MTDEIASQTDVHARTRASLFRGALLHIDDWEPGRLESRSYVAWSSQALCVSVWGTIAESEHRHGIVADILSAAGVVLELGVRPKIECEVRGRRDVLNEYGGSNPTCPDVLVTWSGAALAIESKFTEHLGGCSQVKLQQLRTLEGKATPPGCSGNHEVGSDLRTKSDAPCRLTIKEGNRSAGAIGTSPPTSSGVTCLNCPGGHARFATATTS